MRKNYLMLKGRIVQKFGTQKDFAKKIGISEQSVSKKVMGKTQFTQDEILEWCDALSIQPEDITEYFFTP